MLIDIETQPGSLTPPFNPRKVEELMIAALAAGGFTIPPILPPTVDEGNTLLNVTVESGTYDETQTAEIVAILNAVCIDPTRNDLTEEQVEEADLQAKIDAMVADIGAITDVGGLHDQLLANAAWNALTTDAQADVLRGVLRANGIDYHDIVLDLLRSVRYLLRMEKKRQSGVFSLTE